MESPGSWWTCGDPGCLTLKAMEIPGMAPAHILCCLQQDFRASAGGCFPLTGPQLLSCRFIAHTHPRFPEFMSPKKMLESNVRAYRIVPALQVFAHVHTCVRVFSVALTHPKPSLC